MRSNCETWTSPSGVRNFSSNVAVEEGRGEPAVRGAGGPRAGLHGAGLCAISIGRRGNKPGGQFRFGASDP